MRFQGDFEKSRWGAEETIAIVSIAGKMIASGIKTGHLDAIMEIRLQ
jgi:hypothetical protein